METCVSFAQLLVLRLQGLDGIWVEAREGLDTSARWTCSRHSNVDGAGLLMEEHDDAVGLNGHSRQRQIDA